MLGFSMGAQAIYYWLNLYPDMVEKAVIICSSARPGCHNYQSLKGSSAALEISADYVAERRREVGVREAPLGIQAFGKAYSSWLTRTTWFDKELYKKQGYQTLSDWDRDAKWVNYRGWDPQDLLARLRLWQYGDISSCRPDGGPMSLEATLARIKVAVLLSTCQTNQYCHWGAS